jgi:FkbM family methyltransferase
MELIITEKVSENLNENPTICLNMIVKNESHIIRGTLEKLCSKIQFSYWVICDTGSTDNTKEIICDFFYSKGIDGELYIDEWKNFAHNRTLALQRAFKKTDLLLVFDADDEIVGDIEMPKNGDIIYDEYHLKFGSPAGTAYTRVLLINNKKRFVYQSVLHEFICCLEPNASSSIIKGNYFVVSGRSGSRNQDPEKYLKDAKILEAAHAEALAIKDPLYRRYAFYCANSFKDYGSFEEAIKWYKITLNQDNWDQEHYLSCLNIYECFEKLNQAENGFFYLVKAFRYDKERVECIYPLLVHYCCEGQNQIAYNYYLNIKDYYENHYLSANIDKKLFVVIDKYNFFVPYYMILIADKVQDFDCVIRMFEIIFIKKYPIIDLWYVKNLLYNLQFFVQHVKPDKMKQFIALTDEYIRILYNANVPLNTFDYLKDYNIRFGINISYIFPTTIIDKTIVFSKEECESSKNILFYTGFSDIHWNYSYMQNNALGGSEKAVAYLSNSFPKKYNVYVAGVVGNESFDNVTYVRLHDIPQLINTTPFHTVIVSRYISFYEIFKECSFYQSYIWAHDTQLLPYGCNLNENQILTKWDNYITGCICLTQWHKDQFIAKYPLLTNKITIINNGLDLDSFTNEKKAKKQSNKFIYSSRPERGLDKLLQLWPQIVDEMPDAELVISNYGIEPDPALMDIIKKYDNIKYLGKLNASLLYAEMKTSEYWLYPTSWPETSCITALEMLMSEVICLYYPVAGLPFTIDKHGIQIASGNEIKTLINLTTKVKKDLRENGKNYALTCSWKNRAEEWCKTLLLNKNTKNTKNVAIFNSFYFHYEMFGYILQYCKVNQFNLTFFTNFDNNLGWFDFYDSIFQKEGYEYKHFSKFEEMKEQFDLIFVTTDDDPQFKEEWLIDESMNKKCICIDHTAMIRRPKFKNRLGTRPFIKNYRDWTIPCFPVEYKKISRNNENVIISIIGGISEYKYDVIKRLYSDKSIFFNIIGRNALYFKLIPETNIKYQIYCNLNTSELFELLKNSDFILTDVTENTDHISGISMSGSISLAFSSLTPLIISKQNNAIYKFKNVIEFDLNTTDKINIDDFTINYNALISERADLISMLPNYINEQIIEKNTVDDTVYLRFFSNDGDNNTPQHWMSIEKLETLYNNKVVLTNDDNYTHAVIINTCMPKLNIPKKNVIGISHEPYIWLFINKNKQTFIEYAQKYIDKYFIGDVNDLPKPFTEGQNFFFYNKSNFYYEPKNKFCSFVVSDKNVSWHNTLNYKYRHDLVEEILTTNLPIDIYGHGTKLYKEYSDDRIKYPLESSLDNPFGTIPFEKYKFHICIENVNSNHYFSEKIINPLLSNVTPIYYGCKNIDNYFNNNNIIKLTGDTKQDIRLLKQIFQEESQKEENEKQITDNYQSILDTTNIFNHLHELFDNITLKNTALIVDPRDDENIIPLIHDFQKKLDNKWTIVFYCGKGLKTKMEKNFDKNIEVRELDVNNFTIPEYSDFMKSKELWETLYGEFVLTFQLDTYILNKAPYTIDYFMKLNKSYIGGNMDHGWNELLREKMYINYRNFNGGLSLRKRQDMIKIINTFGIEKTKNNYDSDKIQTDAEDVYFTIGCYTLNLPIGDTVECMHFCVNRIYVDGFFGVHKPIPELLSKSPEIFKIYCNKTNRFIIKNKLGNKIDQKTEIQFYSQFDQDKWLENNIFKGYKNGFYVDVGAHDGISINNTLYFEKNNNWTGINIEPIKSVFNKLVSNRPNNINLNYAVCNNNGETEFLCNTGATEMISGIKSSFDPRHFQRLQNENKQMGSTTEVIKVNTKKLETIFDENNISHINYLSIDVEGAEFEVIKSINFDKVFIDVIEFENNYDDLSIPIIKYLENKNYIIIHRSLDIFMINNKSIFNNPSAIHNPIPELLNKSTEISKIYCDNPKTIGFIILRHVNNIESNEYWQLSYDSIRQFYPENLIMIIDDNSNYNYITEKELYKTQIIKSEYPQRGEILPYYYYLKNKLFDIAVIIHDSVFINKYIDFNVDKYKILWDFEHHWDQISDETRIMKLFNDKVLLSFYENKSLWKGCFGGMIVITHDFLSFVNNKYNLTNILLDVILNKYNRCSLERILGCILNKEQNIDTFFGNIHNYCKFGILFSEKEQYNHLPIIKTWSGR